MNRLLSRHISSLLAVLEPAEKLAYITPSHPLFRAMAAEARKRLLHVWSGERALPPRRLAARRVGKAEPPSAVFTFMGQINAGPEILEERILAVRVKPDLQVLESDALHWLDLDAKTGEVPYAELLRIFGKHFEKMREEAAKAANAELQRASESLILRIRELARALNKDLEDDLKDRLAEIEEEEKEYLGLIEASGQRLLMPEEERKAGGFDARRLSAKTQAENRRKEITMFARVDPPAEARPLGALFLVPESQA